MVLRCWNAYWFTMFYRYADTIYYIYTMMYLELMRIHSVDMAFIYDPILRKKESRIGRKDARQDLRHWPRCLVGGMFDHFDPGANARLERQARIEKELMQQNTQVRAKLY